MTEIEALKEVQNFFDKVQQSKSKDDPYYENGVILQKIIESELKDPEPKYSKVRDFILEIKKQDPTTTIDKRFPSLELLQEEGAIQKYWSYP